MVLAGGLWLGPNEGRPYRIDFNQNGNVHVMRMVEWGDGGEGEMIGGKWEEVTMKNQGW